MGVSDITWAGVTARYTDEERADMRQLLEENPRQEVELLHQFKARFDAELQAVVDDEYVYAWGNNPCRAELKGRRCVVEARGRKRTVLVRFLDTGERVTTSDRAIRRVDPQAVVSGQAVVDGWATEPTAPLADPHRPPRRRRGPGEGQASLLDL